jgi:hypothetical protein
VLDTSALGTAILKSARLWAQDHSPESLKILDEWIVRAEQQSEMAWVDVLCGQASMIAGEMADLRLVRKYCEKMLSHKNEAKLTTAMAHYRLANAMFRHGQVDLAREHAAKSYALVAHPMSDEDRGLLELLLHVWPQVTNWKA